MTRTEQMKLVRRAVRYAHISAYCLETSFVTLCIGVPVTLIAFTGLSVWPAIILWSVSWGSKATGDYYLATARELHRIVNESRTA